MARPRLLAALAPVALALIAPATAPAAQRWAAPDSTVTSGSCTQAAPCRIDAAVNGAAAGDEVVVPSGTYAVITTLDPDVRVDIHGVAGQPRPRLIGASTLTSAVISDKIGGGTLRHLFVSATAAGQDALTLQGVTAEDLIVRAQTGDGGKIVTSSGGTLLRDSVVRTDSSGEGVAGLKLRESSGTGSLRLVNVTVMAPAATGIRCEIRQGQVTLVNTIARGGVFDIEADIAPGPCTARNSSYRPDHSPGVIDGGGNQSVAPLFVNAPAGDYRPAAGSPTIDAGVADAALGSSDPSGCPRVLGSAPDIGAYERPGLGDACAAAPAEPLGAEPTPPAPHGDQGDDGQDDHGDDVPGGADTPRPVIGRHVVVGHARGHVRFRRPGSSRFHTLEDAARIPVGSVIDATDGRVRLASAIDAEGTVQTGTFWGARFVVRQARHGNGMTTLALRGGRFRACRASASGASAASLSGGITRRHRVVRRLWARDRHGRFRTHGRNSVATARGTAWLTQDRCDGTRTRVFRGAVAVRDLARHRTVLVRAGHAYLARRRG